MNSNLNFESELIQLEHKCEQFVKEGKLTQFELNNLQTEWFNQIDEVTKRLYLPMYEHLV